jgi:hypothetical protein
MWPEKTDTARKAAEKFLSLMREKPQLWADNVSVATKDLVNEKEQVDFLKWMADPQNKTGIQDKEIDLVTQNLEALSFENHPDYVVTERIPGLVPTVRVTYKPRHVEVEDEKCPLR